VIDETTVVKPKQQTQNKGKLMSKRKTTEQEFEDYIARVEEQHRVELEDVLKRQEAAMRHVRENGPADLVIETDFSDVDFEEKEIEASEDAVQDMSEWTKPRAYKETEQIVDVLKNKFENFPWALDVCTGTSSVRDENRKNFRRQLVEDLVGSEKYFKTA